MSEGNANHLKQDTVTQVYTIYLLKLLDALENNKRSKSSLSLKTDSHSPGMCYVSYMGERFSTVLPKYKVNEPQQWPAEKDFPNGVIVALAFWGNNI